MALTAAQIKQKINNLLADNTTGAISAADVREVLTDIVDSFGATQVENTMPEWAAGLTFQTDGTDSGEFCRYADTLGNIRLWVTKVDDNTGNAPPSDPNVTENTYWKEVSASNSAAFPEWAAGIYGEGLVIVYHMNAVYKLDAAARPYNSVNIQTEIAAGDWIDLTGSSSPNVYNNVTFDSIEDVGVVSVPFDYLTTNIPQKTIDSQYDYQPNTTGAVDSYGAKQTLIADGNASHIPTFTGFTKWPNSDDWDNTIDAVNQVVFFRWGSTYYYSIINGTGSSSQPTQLLAVTIDTATAGNTEIVLDFTNPNAGDEDSNLIQYKLATEPTVWTDGVSLTSGAITGTQTGLTNGLEYDLRIVAKGSGSFSDADPSNEVSATPNNYSATANAIFARLTTLTTTEKDAINTFVNSQASAEGGNGNYELLDEVYFFGLTNEADALKGWKSAILTKSGSPAKSADGYTFAGTERLITSGLTFSNYTLNNAIVGFDLASVNANLNERVVQSSDGFLDIHSGTASSRVNCALNSTIASIIGFGDFFAAKFHFARYSSSNFYAYYNTTQAQDRAQASSTISSNVLSIGNTDAGSSPYTSIIRGLWIGAQSGFDISAWVTAYNTMLTSLGL